mgnify:FL=1
MKTLSAIVLMLILVPTAFCAGLYWESEMVTTGAPGGDKTDMIKTFHAGYAVRIEQADSITIMDLKSGKIYSLDPKSKSYREINVDEMFKGGKDEQAAQEFVAKMMEDVKVEKTSETRKIGDFNCTKYIVTMMGVNSVYWMTDDVKEFSNLRDETLKYADKFKNNPMLQKSLSMAGGIEKLSGFMIEVTSEVSLGTKPIKTTNTVKKVEKKDFDAATFAVPSDYTKMVSN